MTQDSHEAAKEAPVTGPLPLHEHICEVTLAQTSPTRQAPGNIAFPWWDANCSVVPIRPDGTKSPTREWKPLREARMTEQDVMQSWGNDLMFGVAVICGEISGNLEMLELEGGWTSGEALAAIDLEMDEQTSATWQELCTEGYAEWTPSGGLHLLYRLSDHDVPGNVHIALGPDRKVRAETRGSGGYVVVAPSGGACHPSGEAWVQINGGPETILTITWAQREAIHKAIRDALDDRPPPPPPRPLGAVQIRPAGQLSPADEYSLKTDWADILEPEGWTLAESRRAERLWTRPGKEVRDGASASTDYQGKPGLYVWSTSAGLPTEEPLSKLFVLAHYRFGGDMRACVKDLARQGFGTPLAPRLRSDTFMGTDEPSTEVATIGDKGVSSVEPPPDLVKVSHMDDSRTAATYLQYLTTEVAYVPQRKKWMYYKDGAWKLDYDNAFIRREIRDVAHRIADDAPKVSQDKKYLTWASNAPNAGRVNAAFNMLETYTFVPLEEFDQDRNFLNLKNGTLDLVSMDLLPHDSKQHLTKMMGASYNPAATYEAWQKYLDEVLPDKDTQDFLQRMVGYSLLGYPAERCLAVLHGPGGTGKSRFIEILSTLMGSYGATAAPSLFRSKTDDRGGPSNDLNDLRGTRLASVSELDSGIRMDEALVKRLTGLDRITSRGLYEENQTWTPQCVIWLATNHHFRISSDDGAIWERIKVIPFTQKIENKDPFILDKLVLEADGILNWMLEGLRAYKTRGLSSPPEVDMAVEKYQIEQDTVMEFLRDMTEEDTLHVNKDNHDFLIKPILIKNLYRKWCQERSYAPLGPHRLYARLETMGHPRLRPRGQTTDHFRGLAIGNNGFGGSM